MKILYNTLIFFFIIINEIQAADCIYAPKPTEDDPDSEISFQGNCGEIVNQDFLKLKKTHFERLFFSEKGLAWVLVDDKVFYISKDGKTIRTYLYDNGPDYFEEGLARTIRNNKFGYMDENLEIIIEPEYDFAFPFCNGYAVVCNQCKPEEEGEHKEVLGGQWGVIDKTGKVIIPVEFEKKGLMNAMEFKSLKLALKPYNTEQ